MAIVRALGRHLELTSSPGIETEVARIAATPAKEHEGPCFAGEAAPRLYRMDNVRALISAADIDLIHRKIDHDLLAAFSYPAVSS